MFFVVFLLALTADLGTQSAQAQVRNTDSQTHDAAAADPSKEAAPEKPKRDSYHVKVNGAVLKAKIAQAAASRQLTNLLACPKIDPQNKPKLYTPDTQVYYFGRIFQAYRNTQLKILKDLNAGELSEFKQSFTTESFKKDFIELLKETYKNVQASEELKNNLNTTSDATASALFAIFNDSLHRISNPLTIEQMNDGTLYNEKPGTTLKRPLDDTKVHESN